MKMVMAIIDREEAARVLEALVSGGFTATFSDSRSGFLRQSKETLFIGVDSGKVQDVLTIIQNNCRSHVESRESEAETEGGAVPRMMPRRTFAQVGSAVVFVWDVDRFETY
jgi:uncharacterized protein YaaQ